jgi:hypothetical protein
LYSTRSNKHQQSRFSSAFKPSSASTGLKFTPHSADSMEQLQHFLNILAQKQLKEHENWRWNDSKTQITFECGSLD